MSNFDQLMDMDMNEEFEWTSEGYVKRPGGGFMLMESELLPEIMSLTDFEERHGLNEWNPNGFAEHISK
jgi:hypothetical protein